ncbi:MAG: DNA double-strand break repair nuclease NurA [Thermodesulfobacteriota bacterium]
MMADGRGLRQLIIVRSLVESDLGLFSAHRAAARSKQRAININAPVARQLLSPEFFASGGGEIDSLCVFGKVRIRAPRSFGKTHKNWRLGGNKIDGEEFASLDSKDFMLIRSVAGNDGTHPIIITFACRQADRVVHAGIAAIAERSLHHSMAVYKEGEAAFAALDRYCPASLLHSPVSTAHATISKRVASMPRDSVEQKPQRARTIHEKVRSPHILERMLQVAGDLSAPAQLRFMDTVEQLASQLRKVLLHTGGIIRIEKDHARLWQKIAGKSVGFVDGGLANLSMLGSAPIAARVGGYVVTPGMRGTDREQFTVLKCLIDELYAHAEGGVYSDTFPDIGALRDAARISIETAGAVRMLSDRPDLSWVMIHGALVNPVSRYTDVMQGGAVRHKFPDFSESALGELLPESDPPRSGRDRNFISAHLRQLELLQKSGAVVCGVVERESTTSSVCRAVLESLDDDLIRSVLPIPPARWKSEFRHAIDPAADDDYEGQRINDSLLFRCILDPGEALLPVTLDRNEMRRAPEAWKDVIGRYPKPKVSYLQTTEWSAPIRVEMFDKDVLRYRDTAALVMHCAFLLPRYAFPVGLDIVDKFAKIPNWMSRPINTHTAVTALKRALDQGDTKLFDSLRRMLCGSGREWLLRPGIYR